MKFLREPFLYPIKMVIVFMLLRWLYLYFTSVPIDWSHEITIAVGGWLLFCLVYSISALFSFNIESSPLFVQKTIVNEIIKDLNSVYTLDNHRGLFVLSNVEVIEGKLLSTYNPIENSNHLLGKIAAYKKVINRLDTIKSDALYLKLEKYEQEITYMNENDVRRIII